MKKIKIIVFALVFVTSLFAQTDFRSGYVIKSVGDTLWGEVDYRGDKKMGEICTFRKSKGDEVTTFTPDDILGFRFINSKYYISRVLNEKKVFLEFLINGKVNIYYRRDEISDHYYIEKEDEPLIEMPYEEVVKSKNNKNYLYKSTKHIGILTYYMKDAQDLIAIINNMRKPEHKNLIQLAEKYHNEVCDGEKCIIYEKKLPPFSVDLELISGITHINPYFINDLNLPFPTVMPIYGVLGHFWLPRESENLYLKTGIVLIYNEKTRLYKIPFQLEYLYPTGIIRPRISAGFDNFILDPTCSVGANIVFSKSVSLSLNCDATFRNVNSEILLPDKFFSSSLYAGLRIKL